MALKALDIPYSFYDESFTNYSGSVRAGYCTSVPVWIHAMINWRCAAAGHSFNCVGGLVPAC